MKRQLKILILLTILMGVFASPTFAACNYLNRCAESPYKSQNLGQSFANATGANTLVENFAQNIIQSELKKATNQDFQVAIKILGVQELFEGKFKSLTVTGKNIEIEGFHFTSLKVQTLCDFNHVNVNSRPITLKQNMVLAFSTEFSSADLRNTIEYKNYSEEFSKINLSRVGISSFRVYSPTIDIRNGKLYFTINATHIGLNKPMDIAIGADIKALCGRVVTSKIDFVNLYTGFDLTQFSELLSTLNNLNFPVKLGNNQKAEVQIQTINIVGDKIFINGLIFIPKSSI